MLCRIVANIVAIAEPAVTFLNLLFFWINKRFHALIVWWVRFEEIDNIERIFNISLDVFDSEKEPLCKQGIDWAKVWSEL